MGWLKKISKGMEKAERKYKQIEKDTRGARRVAMGVVDAIIPPPKKKGKVKRCKCPPTKKRR